MATDAQLRQRDPAARPLPDPLAHTPPGDHLDLGWMPADALRRRGSTSRFVLALGAPHAPADALRSEIHAVNDGIPLDDVLAECRRYFSRAAGRRGSSST